MSWFVASCVAKGESLALQLQEALERMSPPPEATAGFETDEDSGVWEASGYFSNPPDTVGLSLLSAMLGAPEFVVTRVEAEDWTANYQRLPPVLAGRFIIHGKHYPVDSSPEKIPIMIDASLAFGTGHHATTKLCIEHIDALHCDDFKPMRCADIGCGTGILGIAAAKLWNCLVECSDNDETAVAICRQNTVVNGVSALVSAHLAEGTPRELFPSRRYDLVVANILSGPLISLAEELNRLLRRDGRLLLSGITKEQSDNVISAYENHGMSLLRSSTSKSWVVLEFNNSRELS